MAPYSHGVHWGLLVAFGVAVTPLVVTPGASFSLVVSSSPRGMGHVLRAITGTAGGILTHAVLAGVGLSALVMRSAQAYRAVQLLGAVYLVVLGIGLLRSSRRATWFAPTTPRWRLAHGRGPLVTGYVANVLNPKAAGVYLTLAPQFVSADSVGVTSLLALAAVHVVIMAGWLAVVGLALTLVVRRSATERVLRVVRRTGGALLVVLGLRSMPAPAA